MFQIPRPAASTPKLAGLGGFLPQLTCLQASQLTPKRGRGESGDCGDDMHRVNEYPRVQMG